MEVTSVLFSFTKPTGEIDMSRKINAFFSSLIAGVIFLAVFFIIVPWLLIVLVVVGIAIFASMFLGRGSINITTVRITNTTHGNLVRAVKTISSTVGHKTGAELLEQTPIDITIHPDGSASETAPENDSFKLITGALHGKIHRINPHKTMENF